MTEETVCQPCVCGETCACAAPGDCGPQATACGCASPCACPPDSSCRAG